jgi:hypothetical protein
MKFLFFIFGIFIFIFLNIFIGDSVQAVENFDSMDIQDILPNNTDKLLSNAKNLPHGDINTHFIPRFIDILMKISYTIAVMVILYAGILYIVAGDEDAEITNAKNILIYGAVGFFIITVSYAVIQGVVRLQFF